MRLCINALSKQTYPKELFEVIIVNNNPNDSVPANLMLSENFKIITEEKPGSYAARNAALKVAKGEIIGFTDSDCIPDNDWIKNTVDYLNNNKNCFRIAGNVVVFPKSIPPSTAEKYDKLFAFQQKKYVTKWGTCVTANMFSYKSVFDAVGLFDDKRMSYGDLSWGVRAHKAGYKIDYLESCIVNHPARSLKELIKKVKRLAGGSEGPKYKKTGKLTIYLKFFSDMRPRIRGELKFLREQGKELKAADKISIFLLRLRLIYVRATENRKIRMGKKPNRE